jgi:hypothetical protein
MPSFPTLLPKCEMSALVWQQMVSHPLNLTALSYPCWPVFAVPYNLLSAICMKYRFIFLCLIIPGPDHPRKKIDVEIRPLIEDLKLLWEGVESTIYIYNGSPEASNS